VRAGLEQRVAETNTVRGRRSQNRKTQIIDTCRQLLTSAVDDWQRQLDDTRQQAEAASSRAVEAVSQAGDAFARAGTSCELVFSVAG
jgi:ElaB/YqjD/DUF883 family membrane-anchored ribosome-binding protein